MLVTSHIYETLFTWDGEYRPVPLLAAGHEISDDGLLITLRLREGVPFHNGEAMQASDVVASVNRWSANSGSARACWKRPTRSSRSTRARSSFG